MSEYLHVGKPYLDQLSTLSWTVIDQGQIPTDLAPSLASLSCLFGFSCLSGFFGSMHKTNKTNQTNQTNQRDQTNSPRRSLPHRNSPFIISLPLPRKAG